MTSTGMPATVPPISSTAIWAASTEPLPDRSAYSPDMSVSTPMTILLLPPPVATAAPLALPWPVAGALSFLQAAAEHSATAHNVTTIERSAIRLGRCLNMAAPVWFRRFERRRGDVALNARLDSEINAQP